MKKKTKHFLYYERLMKMQLEKSMEKTPEFEVLSKSYPHIAQSIKLKREIERLEKKRGVLKERNMKLRIEKEILGINAKLRQTNILKKLHGESRREALFHIRFALRSFEERIVSLARRISIAFGAGNRKIRGMFFSPVFDMKSLDQAERSLALREWLHKHRKKLSIKPRASGWLSKKSRMLEAEKFGEPEKNRGSTAT